MAADELPQVPKHTLLFEVSWQAFHSHSIQLAKKLHALGPWKAVVGISRGGLFPAALIARELDLRLVGVISIASYHEYQVQGKLEVLQKVSPEIIDICGPRGEGLVIIDDLVDTGLTMREVGHMYPAAHRASLYVKNMGFLHVGTSFIQVSDDTWIRLPWDTDPMTLALRPTLEEIHRQGTNGGGAEATTSRDGPM